MEHFKLSMIEGLKKYKKVTISLDYLLALAVGIDVKELKDQDLLSESEKKKINSVNLFDFPKFATAISQLCNENILVPYGRVNTKGIKSNYRVVGNQRETERDKELAAKVMTYQLPGMEYYTRKLSEFKEDMPILDLLNDYYKQEVKRPLTANELGVLLFQDEKAFEQADTREQRNQHGLKGTVLPSIGNGISSKRYGFALAVINKLRIDLEDKFNAKITIEPFFYKVRESFYEKTKNNERRNIIIIENKDTYYTFYRTELDQLEIVK